MTHRDTPVLTKGLKKGLFFVLVLSFGVSIGGLAGSAGQLSQQLLFAEAERIIAENALAPIPDGLALQRGMIEGMLLALEDPYAAFLPPPQRELEAQTLSGTFGGIGAYLARTQDGRPYLVPFEGSPAEAAGILPGDLLVQIDGLLVQPDTDQESLLAELRGDVGTWVELRLQRGLAPGPLHVVRVTREQYQVPSIVSFQSPDAPQVGILHISRFTERTAIELETQYTALLSSGCNALVLDLRENQGGLLDSAIKVTDFFLAEGIIYFEVRQLTELVASAKPGDSGETIPLAVVIDGSTISAAELVAGALQANDRATLFGSPSFGKGTVQTLFQLSDGSSLHVTSATWLTPDRREIEGHGIEPDIAFDPAVTDFPDAGSLAIASLLVPDGEAGDG